MNALIVSTTVLLTIVLCLAFGVGCGYAVVFGVLRLFGHKHPKPQAAGLTTAHASGD